MNGKLRNKKHPESNTESSLTTDAVCLAGGYGLGWVTAGFPTAIHPFLQQAFTEHLALCTAPYGAMSSKEGEYDYKAQDIPVFYSKKPEGSG